MKELQTGLAEAVQMQPRREESAVDKGCSHTFEDDWPVFPGHMRRTPELRTGLQARRTRDLGLL